MADTEYRIEHDTMGEVKVPAKALWRAQTQRAVENFPISDLRFNRRFISAMGLIKWACANVNHKLGVLDERRRTLLQQAAQEVIDGKIATARVDGSIEVVDWELKPVITYTFLQGWPCKYSAPGLNASGNEILVEEIEIAHEGFTRA